MWKRLHKWIIRQLCWRGLHWWAYCDCWSCYEGKDSSYRVCCICDLAQIRHLVRGLGSDDYVWEEDNF